MDRSEDPSASRGEGDSGGTVDEEYMRAALDLAAKGRWTAHPNPAVGAVVVRDGAIVGRGYHERPGSPHAELQAIADAAGSARGADLYVTLEPCLHHGKTPPCVEAIVESGIRRVFVGALDPDDKVSGGGVEFLGKRGVEVVTGVLEQEAVSADPAYFHHRRTGRPFVRYKVAATLDGFVAAADGSSKWITSDEARLDAHLLRAQADAVVVGVGTVVADDPLLTCRLDEYRGPQPLRVVFDSRGRLTGREKIFQQPGAVMVVTTAPGAERFSDALGSAGLESVRISDVERPPWDHGGIPRVVILTSGTGGGSGASSPRIDVTPVLQFLGSMDTVEILLEGGPTLAGSFLEAGSVDEMVVYVGSKVVGGGGVPILVGNGVCSIQEARHWSIREATRIGQDVRIVARPGDRESQQRR